VLARMQRVCPERHHACAVPRGARACAHCRQRSRTSKEQKPPGTPGDSTAALLQRRGESGVAIESGGATESAGHTLLAQPHPSSRTTARRTTDTLARNAPPPQG